MNMDSCCHVPTNQRCWSLLIVGLVFGAAACTGSIGSTSSEGSQGGETPRIPEAELPPPSTAENAIFELPGDANLAPRIRLKSHREIFNTIKETFGYVVTDPLALPPETVNQASGFFNDSTSHRVGETYFVGMSRLAATVKDAMPAAALTKFCTGTPATHDACARATIRGYGEKLTGKVMPTDQVDKLVSIYTAYASVASHEVALRAIVETLLQLPSFLYRTEFGEPAGEKVLRLTGPELAAALSSLLWETGPDDLLRKDAAEGNLASAANIEAQAMRMLGDPKARSAFSTFVIQWLGLRDLDKKIKDPETFPDYNQALPEQFLNETRAFSEHVVFESDSSLKTLLTANTTRVNKVLATYYGLSSVPSDSFVETSLPAKRAGILSHGSFILAHSGEADTNPIRRGSFVQRQLLCGVIPDPPAVLDAPEVMITAESTVEDLYPQHRIPACKGCHVFMNPLGFGFEDLDSIGKLRSTDNGRRIDSAGYVMNTTNSEKKEFAAGELYTTLAQMPETAACFTLRLFQYAMGRPPGHEDQALLLRLARTFRANNFRVMDLLMDIVTSEAFSTRRSQ